mmetsp:Transcript_30461/g.65366  ORF Transcript_30461/g.65366 Transcript_30461/m.65366 type:complete len:252 (+) Transcript_30461:1444-2199(+)
MHERTLLVTGRIIVPEKHRLGSVAVGVVRVVIGEGVVGPVLFHPQPLASSDEIGTESEQVVDPGLLGGGSMVGIVLDVQSDERLRNTVDDGQDVRGGCRYPKVLEREKEGDVEEGTRKITIGSKLTSASNDFEDFLLDFAFEFGVPLVLAAVIRNGTNVLHLFQVLAGVVRVDHLVLNRTVVSSEHLNRFTTGVVEVLDVVDGAIDNNLSFSEGLQRGNARFSSVGVGEFVQLLGVALPQAISVWSHCRFF